MKKLAIISLFAGFMCLPSAMAHCGSCGSGNAEEHTCSVCESGGNPEQCALCKKKKAQMAAGDSSADSSGAVSVAPASAPALAPASAPVARPATPANK